MSKKIHFFVLFLAIGVAILVPAIQYGKASLFEEEAKSGSASTSPKPTIVFEFLPIKIEAVAEAAPLPAPEIKKSTKTTPKKIQPKISVSKPAPIVDIAVPIAVSCARLGFNEEFLCLINEHRKKHNRGPLIYDGQLSSTARIHSEWMTNSGITSHIGENDSKFYERCAKQATKCFAENIVKGFTSAQHLFDLWKGSPSHNATMLGNYSVVGLGIYSDHATTLFR